MRRNVMGRTARPALNDLLGEVQNYVDATLEPGTAAIYRTTFDHFRQFAGNPPLWTLGPRDFDRIRHAGWPMWLPPLSTSS